MNSANLQDQCELGQRQLMDMRYLEAQATLAAAADLAWKADDFDTLSRVYMPLQEARRQIRQRAGEGIVCLDLLARSATEQPDPQMISAEIPHGQLLVGGWAGIQPALELRRLQALKGQYAETFLAAVYPVNNQPIVAIIPLPTAALPPPANQSLDELTAALPPHSILLPAHQLPTGRQRGSVQTYAYVMDLWERLHTPFLAAADKQQDLQKRMEAYRLTIDVDNACEFAHQRLASAAKLLSRQNPANC